LRTADTLIIYSTILQFIIQLAAIKKKQKTDLR